MSSQGFEWQICPESAALSLACVDLGDLSVNIVGGRVCDWRRSIQSQPDCKLALCCAFSFLSVSLCLSCQHHLEADSLLEAHDNWWWNKKEAANTVAKWTFANIFLHDNRLKHREERRHVHEPPAELVNVKNNRDLHSIKDRAECSLDCISFSVSCFTHHLFHVTTNGIMGSTFVQLDFNQIQNFSHFFAK